MTMDIPPWSGPSPERSCGDRGGTGIDDLVSTYARLLFDLAYRLTGDPREAADLSLEILVRCCLAADRIEDPSEAVASLYRDLLQHWRGRTRPRRLRELFLGAASDPPAPGGGPAGQRHLEHLQPRLMRLDADSRAVLVLRVGEGLDYEEIASIFGIPLEEVRSRLALARRRVRRREQFESGLDEMMNLYLDGRLKRGAREEFERRVESDAALREAIEFHRGLTLEFREEAPPFPRDFADRARARLERSRAARRSGTLDAAAGTRPDPALRPALPWWRRALILEVLAGIAAGLIVAVVLYPGLLRVPATQGQSIGDGAAAREAAGDRGVAADGETIKALRSLGYLAPGGSGADAARKSEAGNTSPHRPPGQTGRAKKPRRGSQVTAAKTEPERSAAAEATPAGQMPAGEGPRAAAESTPGPPIQAAAGTPVASTAQAPAGPSPSAPLPLPFRAMRLPKGPGPGRDHQVIRSAAQWAAFAEALDLPAPDVVFDHEMLVVLRDDLGGDPSSRLVVASVTLLADALEIQCRVEPTDPAAATAGPGLALIVPATDLPIRIVTK